MKYESEINKAFSQFKLTPRPGQVDAVNSIVSAFIDDKVQNCICNAPTGAGKSIIGMITAEVLHQLKSPSAPYKASIVLCSTNALSKQYEASFTPLLKDDFIMLKGAGNYDCTALSTPDQDETADSCAWYTMIKASSEYESILSEHCSKCEYLKIKQRKNSVRHLTTNYSYFFIDRMYSGKFEERDLIVWDEAHLINDLFSEHNAIYFSKKRALAMKLELAENVKGLDLEIAKTITAIGNDCAKEGKINEKNYESYLNALITVYKYAKEQGALLSDRALRTGHMPTFTRLTRFTKKYEGLLCKIDDLFNYNYPHVFEHNIEEGSISVKPVFVDKMMEALQCAPHNLFMSATVSSGFMQKTLGLTPENTKFIQLPPTFPPENKEVVFYDTLSLSYTSLKDPGVVKTLGKNVVKIVNLHVSEGQRGIILTPSFKLQGEIIDSLKADKGFKGYRLFEHKQGEKLEPLLNIFKAYDGGSAVLISPSLYEGIDLPGELSRFQVIVKAPFPSLGDKRIKYIADTHPDIYSTITIMKLVQGAGRSVRSPTDHATTYVLDANAQRLWSGGSNIWKGEFNTRYTKFL